MQRDVASFDLSNSLPVSRLLCVAISDYQFGPPFYGPALGLVAPPYSHDIDR
jgi:hypothetical protein